MDGVGSARSQRRGTASLRRLAPRGLRRHESLDDVFERFYRKHVAEVYQYALALLGNSADAEDVTQQTFLNAYRAFQRGGRPTKPHNWLIKIAHNVCRMRWRQLERRPSEVPLEAAPEPAALDGEKPSLDEVLRALTRLPFNQRAAIVMREVEDRSYAEIAEVLGVTVPASIGSFFGGGSGGVVAAGGAVIGSELALKAAAVVATTALAGGLGYKAVDAVATPQPLPTPSPSVGDLVRAFAPDSLQPVRAEAKAASRRADVALFHHARPAATRQRRLKRAPTNDRPSGTATSAAAAAPAARSAAEAGSSAGSSPSTTVPSAAATTVGGVVTGVPTVPAVSAPSVTVSTPLVTTTVSVPTVTVPPPPGLK